MESIYEKIIYLILGIAIVLSAVPALAADNAVKPNGERIDIGSTTPSTVWVDQTGGTLAWDKDASAQLKQQNG